ncbi:MAG: hypothetical protein K9H16_06210 [Bacteroidales bacterium]|nr:hypothetical protein [Bacteroidales bacterium]
MNIIQLINIFRKHILLIVTVPMVLVVIVGYLTRNPTLQYESESIIYTGLASGNTLEQKDKFDLFGSKNAFDNLINVIKSRETKSETAIRLFAMCLSLNAYDKTIISKNSFIDLRKFVPQYIKDMVVRPVFADDSVAVRAAYEQTVHIFTEYKNSSDTNFIYNLLNFNHKYFSIKAISGIKVNRVQNSDLIEIKFTSDDPGITMRTIEILTRVFISNYKSLKENQSDAVVAYFQNQVKLAQTRLKTGEDGLLSFNKGNKIINYYEQSKFIAAKKEAIEEDIQLERMKMAGAEQALQRLESQLQVQGQIQGISDEILIKRNRLVDITEKLTINEIYNEPDTASKNEMARLREEANLLENQLNNDVSRLFSFSNSIDGLPISNILSEWLSNLIKYAEAKAGLQVLFNRQEEFSKNYDLFAPLGANISRIEREIDVAEREYLSLLHSLNEAKLRQQNEQLSSNIKPMDPPYFPISAIPSKRKLLIIAAGLFGLILVAFSILLTEYFDNTIKNLARTENLTGLKPIGIMPKIISKYRAYNMPFITNRLVEMLLQEIKFITKSDDVNLKKQNKLIIIFSNTNKEGKTFLANKLVDKLRTIGERVLYLNYTNEEKDFEPDGKKAVTEEKRLINRLNPISLFKFSFFHKKDNDLLEIGGNADNLTYPIDDSFSEKQDIFDLITDPGIHSLNNFQYVILEIPAILFNFYPTAIIKQSDMNIMVVRSNREWKKSDDTTLEMFIQFATSKPAVFLNGVEIEELEGVLGTLPKKRSKLRKMLKQLLKFQFYTKSSIN